MKEKFVVVDDRENLPGDECKELVKNFMQSDGLHENLPGDETDSWKVHSRGAVLYSLSNEECKNLIENFMDSNTIHETLEGDMTDSWSFTVSMKIISMEFVKLQELLNGVHWTPLKFYVEIANLNVKQNKKTKGFNFP